MPRKCFSVEQIIHHLREADVLLAQAKRPAKRIAGSPTILADVRFSPNYVRSTPNNRRPRRGRELLELTQTDILIRAVNVGI